MKKVLLATTALVATAGFAAADISLSGSANMGISYLEGGTYGADSDRETQLKNEIDFNIVASGTSDSGIEFGASMDIDGNREDGSDDNGNAADAEVYVSVSGFKVITGHVGSAGDVDNVGDVGFDDIGADDLLDTDEGAYDLHVSYGIAGVTIAAAMGSATDDFSASISGEMSGLSFAIGTTTDDSASEDTTAVALGYTVGAVTLNATYASKDAATDVEMYAVGVTYTQGAMTVKAVMSDSDATGQDSTYGVGVSYDLGGGLAVAGGFGRNKDDKSVADLGLTMSF